MIPTNNFEFLIDNSSLREFVECQRRGYYNIFRRKIKNEEKAAFFFGQRLHEAIAAYTLKKDVLEALSVLKNGFKNYNPGMDWRTWELADITFKKWVYNWEMDKFVPLFVEKPFCFYLTTVNFPKPTLCYDINTKETRELTSLPVYYTGRIDLIFQRYDTIFFRDYKTSSIGGNSFFDEFFISNQMKGYCWAAKQIMGKPVLNFEIDALIVRKPTASNSSSSHSFLRQQFSYTEDHIEEWKTSTKTFIANLFNAYFDNYFPMGSACVGRYGKCPYYDVCQLPPNGREFLLESNMYIDKTWDPIEQKQEIFTNEKSN